MKEGCRGERRLQRSTGHVKLHVQRRSFHTVLCVRASARAHHHTEQVFQRGWVNIIATNGKDSDLDWDNIRTYRLGINLAEEFKLHSIGDSDLDHLQDENYPSWTNLPRTELIQG